MTRIPMTPTWMLIPLLGGCELLNDVGADELLDCVESTDPTTSSDGSTDLTPTPQPSDATGYWRGPCVSLLNDYSSYTLSLDLALSEDRGLLDGIARLNAPAELSDFVEWDLVEVQGRALDDGTVELDWVANLIPQGVDMRFEVDGTHDADRLTVLLSIQDGEPDDLTEYWTCDLQR